MATAPVEAKVLLTLIEEAEEVRDRDPNELILLAAIVSAPPELRETPLVSDKAEEFASMFKLDEEVMLLFNVIPELAVRATAPVAVMLPVRAILEGEFNVKAPPADIPPEIALSEISLALANVTPLAIIILSFGDKLSATLLESPSKVRAPTVVVTLVLTSMPLTDSAFKVENVDAP